MALHKDFPKDKFQILDPSIRWFPADEDLRKEGYEKLLPPFVPELREKVAEWRKNNYEGASETSKSLLNWWFKEPHTIYTKDGTSVSFQYYYAQREAVETIVWLYDVEKVENKYDLIKFDKLGRVSPNMFSENWLRFVVKMATGSGKTKVMSLLLAWSYFHKLYEDGSELSKNFLLITPNIIVLDRIINGPDPESENSGIISAQYDDVYPYFDHYVEVVSEAKDEEILAEELSVYLKEYGDFGRQAFQATLGDLDSYLTKEKSYLDVMAGEPIVRLEMKANASALFNQIKTFLTEMDNYAKDRKTIYEPYCQTGSIEDQRDCLISFGYVSEDVDYTFLSGLAFLVNFDKLDVILDADNKDFLGIDLSISLKQTAFELLKKTFPGETGGLANINSLNFQLAFRDMPPQKIKAIEKPSSYFRFLPEGEDFVVDRETKSDTEKLAEQLFLINYNYVWETELEKLSQDKTTYCQEKWEPNFCLEMNANWREDYLAYSADSFEFLYFPYYDLLRGKEISFKFKNDQNVGEGLFCDGEKYDDFYEIKTQDGLVFRINRLATNDQSQEFLRDDFLVDVCYQNPDGKFTTVSPLARSIELYSQHMTFEELCQKVGVILETIKLQDPSQADLTQEYSQVFEGSETLFLGGAKGDPNSCSVSFYRDQNSFSRAYENIKKDFSIEREFNDIVIEENTVFCQWAETTEDKYCLKCVGGKLEWTEMDDCRGLSCNP